MNLRNILYVLILLSGPIWIGEIYHRFFSNPVSYTKIVFEDTFQGSKLDKQKWNTDLKVFGRKSDNYHNDSYANILDASNVEVSDSLFLRTKKTGEDGYSSGMVSSHEKFVFRYGYIEVYAKYPSGNGVWPAFWLMPQDQTWPPEIDVAEYYGGSKIMHTGLCYGDFPEVNWDSNGYSEHGIENDFSTYGLYWTPDMLVWYFNGEVKKVVKGNYVPKIPMYIILSNGVSTKIGPSGEPDENTKFPNTFEIKYVRVYQQ
jgi:beta-glucanase (GH16 family)